jgi:hypothetical protein
MRTRLKRGSVLPAPAPSEWRRTDAEEINRRRLQARREVFQITNLDPAHPVFSNFRVASRQGPTHAVEIRDLRVRHFACDCADFRLNGLGTCKHVEAVLHHLETRLNRRFEAAMRNGSSRVDLVPDPARNSLRLLNGRQPLPAVARRWFDREGRLKALPLRDAVAWLAELRQSEFPALRVSQEVAPFLRDRRRAAGRRESRPEDPRVRKVASRPVRVEPVLM